MPQVDPRRDQSVGTVLAKRAAATPDAAFIVSDDRTLSFREADLESNRVANAVEGLGVDAGGTVLVLMPNIIAMISVWLGLAKRGAIQVPVNTAYRGSLLVHVINDSAADTMIVESTFLERLGDVAGELEHLRRLIVLDQSGDGAPLPSALAHMERLDFAVLLDAPDTARESFPAHHDLKAIMYTSGTTGPSKGVMITHAHAYTYAHGGVDLMDLVPGDVYYAPLPLFHIAGQWACCYASMIAGSTSVITERFSVERFWEDAKRFNATVTFFLGAMANFLARQPEQPGDAETSIERALVVPMFPDVHDFGKRFGMRIKTTYGSTETCSPHRMGWDYPNWKTCGKLLDEYFEARIVDENDLDVPNGTVGEFCVRGKEPWLLMAGYWRHPEWTEKAWSNLWLHSGDAMWRDDEGYYYFADRVKDSIRRRGENISSMEVENEINLHPDVVECAVFPVPSEYLEDEVMVTVVTKPGRELDPVDLIRFLEPRMAHFMVPRFIDIVEALPKTPTGKIQKFDLRDVGTTPTTWDREAAGIKVKR
ncbi:MAG: AMP-binding protein [Rhodospirillaceae bacterium]|jgi:carnitine-CoA ligase|nr:AMP-binding protein [Rhodospirillaceae bacterium]MBT6512231.1 AMP-binding protein [Rhodospirillaceae bacterium]MBT7647227.1 AMP-binding protein [Rhodospirillaceae bacterium]